jgi:hypothetical protein
MKARLAGLRVRAQKAPCLQAKSRVAGMRLRKR